MILLQFICNSIIKPLFISLLSFTVRRRLIFCMHDYLVNEPSGARPNKLSQNRNRDLTRRNRSYGIAVAKALRVYRSKSPRG